MVIELKEVVALSFPVFAVLAYYFASKAVRLIRSGNYWLTVPEPHWDRQEQLDDGNHKVVMGVLHGIFAVVLIICTFLSLSVCIKVFNITFVW